MPEQIFTQRTKRALTELEVMAKIGLLLPALSKAGLEFISCKVADLHAQQNLPGVPESRVK